MIWFAESEAAADGSRCPLGWRPTAYLKSDGSKFRGTDSSIIVNQGWRQRGVPMRQILWNYNEADSWEVEFKDPKQPPSYVTTGNNEPILGEVKFRAPTLLGDARRTLRIPCASQSPLTLGEVVGELLDVADAEPELGDQKVGISAGQGDVGGGPDHLSLESSFRSGSSLEEDEGSRPPSGNGAVLADLSLAGCEHVSLRAVAGLVAPGNKLARLNVSSSRNNWDRYGRRRPCTGSRPTSPRPTTRRRRRPRTRYARDQLARNLAPELTSENWSVHPVHA